MLLHFLMMADAEVDAPTLGSVLVSVSAPGGCPGPTADTIRATWGIANANAFYFETKVYLSRDGGPFNLEGTVANTTVTFDEPANVGPSQVPGSLSALSSGISISWRFRVDVVRKSTGEVERSSTSSAYVDTFKTSC